MKFHASLASVTLLAMASSATALSSFDRMHSQIHSLARRHFGASSTPSAALDARDISTDISGGKNNEGEAHGKIKAPSGSTFTSLPVGTGGETIAAYWTANPDNSNAKHAYIMIHGRLRDGDAYWTTMNNVLKSAVAANYPGASDSAIVVAPEFFSKKYNKKQYNKNMLAWADVNAWQAGDPAIYPSKTKLTSFDALDALVAEFTDTNKYPSMKNITVVGHGGGGQLNQRYAMVAKTPTSNAVHIRYIHGDPSSCAYFTTDRPTKIEGGKSLSSKKQCKYYNTWRYGFDKFTGTSDGLKTPKQYFQQYITRDVVSIVGYDDVKASGDTYCMARMQGGTKRRDRNLAWWQYVNTLARTNENLHGFPATFDTLPDWSDVSNNVIGLRLTVVDGVGHSADKVFGSSEGRAALFSKDVPTGWRPSGWTASRTVKTAHKNNGGNSTSHVTRASTFTGSSTGATDTSSPLQDDTQAAQSRTSAAWPEARLPYVGPIAVCSAVLVLTIAFL